MKYVSTRGSRIQVSASQAIVQGLAEDGGLFVPTEIPRVDASFLQALCADTYQQKAQKVLGLYLEEFSREEMDDVVRMSYAENFDVDVVAPLHVLDDDTGVLELWHGPTSAFKDMALQVMPRLLTSSLRKNGEERTVSILVATSGDTGKAALEGFRDVPGTRIMVFYPQGGVSEMQKRQMVTQEGDNVNVVAVEGNFDDAQAGVKKIFSDRAFAEQLNRRGFFLSSANSINWGRLAPQIVYYFSAYCDMVNGGRLRLGEELDFCVPTGNFGDILAGWYAKRMGLPVGRLICASNDNHILSDFLGTGVYDKNRPFYLTSSPSMDILVSSNLERLLYHLSEDAALVIDLMQKLSADGRYAVSAELLAKVRAEFVGGWCGQAEAAEEIDRLWRSYGYLIDTHTAVASRVLRDLRAREGQNRPTVVLSTASPFKFPGAVMAALGGVVDDAGPMLLEALQAFTGVAVPKPLSFLAGKRVRFENRVPVAGMQTAVSDFLV